MDYWRKARTVQAPVSRRIVAGCLLWLFLGTTTPLAPILTAVVGWADRSHHVGLQQTVNGLQVVLRHDCSNSPTHRHGIIARALTLIAQRPVGPQPDHVIQFAAGGPLEPASAVAFAQASEELGTHLFIARDALPSWAGLTIAPASHGRPPSDVNGWLLHNRSTVLLL